MVVGDRTGPSLSSRRAYCAVHQTYSACGQHGRGDAEKIARATISGTGTDQLVPVCACDDGWGVVTAYSYGSGNVRGDLSLSEDVLDCAQRDSECTDGATHITVFVVLTTLVLLFPLCCCGICTEPADDAARDLPRPMVNNWDGVLIDLSSRKNWTRPCVLLLPVTAGFITASAVLLNGEALEYTWDDCVVEAAMIALLCVVMPTAAGLWMISRSANGCLPPKGDCLGHRHAGQPSDRSRRVVHEPRAELTKRAAAQPSADCQRCHR